MVTYLFADRIGRMGWVGAREEPVVGGPLTISAAEAVRLVVEHGDMLPFKIVRHVRVDRDAASPLSVADLQVTPEGVTLRRSMGMLPFAIIDPEPALRPDQDQKEWHCPAEDAEHWEKARWEDDGAARVLCGACGVISAGE